MTFVRKATWRNKTAKENYFKKCDEIQQMWEEKGPQLLHSELRNLDNIQRINCENKKHVNKHGNENDFRVCDSTVGEEISYPYGIYLFKDRKTIVKYFKPNFFPPYNTDKNKNIIMKILSKTWDEKNLQWIHNS